MSKQPADFADKILCLKKADLDALRRAWQSGSRRPFPDHLPRNLVVGLIAWQLQASQMGGLSIEEEKYLAGIAGKPIGTPIEPFGKREGSHQVGTVFVRQHGGVAHRVVKTEGGFDWHGQQYSSLSAAASAITGTKWNGLRFFGVPAPGRKSRG